MSQPTSTELNELQLRLAAAEQRSRELQTKLDETSRRMEHFMHAVEEGPVVVVISDSEGKITYVNPKFVEVTGYTEDEVRGRSAGFLKSGETTHEVYDDLWQTIQQGKTWTGIFHNCKKNGEFFWERATISAMVDPKNQATHYISIKEDITALRQAEGKVVQEQLRNFHQSKMAEIGLLTASILHEVGNPIAAISGLVTSLIDNMCDIDCGFDDARSHMLDSLKLVREQADRLVGITHNISDFTAPQSGERELFDLNGAIRSTSRLIQFDQRLRNVDLQLQLDPQLPALYGHREQMTHLTLNLIINAADAVQEAESAQPKISLTTEHGPSGILMTVGDNGCGMSEEVQQHALDAFYTTKKPGKGTGLGLSLCDSIIKAHGGTLDINSSPGRGTVFTIHLPLVEPGSASRGLN